jgi:hypothetical protein
MALHRSTNCTLSVNHEVEEVMINAEEGWGGCGVRVRLSEVDNQILSVHCMTVRLSELDNQILSVHCMTATITEVEKMQNLEFINTLSTGIPPPE